MTGSAGTAILAEEGPLTAAELAHRSSTVERYAREWLEHQSVSGIVTADLDHEPVRFALPRTHADVLADADSAYFMAPMARFFAATGARLPDLVQAYRYGGGVSWEQFGADAREAQGALNRPMFLHQLTTELLPQVADLHQTAAGRWQGRRYRLRRGMVDDRAGAGVSGEHGRRLRRRHAFDPDGQPQRGRPRCDRTGFIQHNRRGRMAPAGYDAVFAFECIHDLPDPVGGTRGDAAYRQTGRTRDRDG